LLFSSSVTQFSITLPAALHTERPAAHSLRAVAFVIVDADPVRASRHRQFQPALEVYDV